MKIVLTRKIEHTADIGRGHHVDAHRHQSPDDWRTRGPGAL